MASLDVMCIASSPLSKEKKGGSDSGCGCRCVKKISIDVSLISSLLTTSRETIDTENTNTNTNINNIIDNNMKCNNEVDEEYKNDKDRIKIVMEGETETQHQDAGSEGDDDGDGDGEKNGYYYRNRERKLEYQKKYNREQGDKIKNYNKDYYQKRREEILEKAKTKIICECGCEVQLFNMNSHKKTKKHAKALQRVMQEKNLKL
jgi:hypothetical protein